MILPKGLSITDIIKYSCIEQVKMEGNHKERRHLLKNNIRELKKAFKKLSKEKKQQFINETIQIAGQE